MTLTPTPRLVGALWCLLWQLLGASSPAAHRLASPAEVQLIEASLAEAAAAAAAGAREAQGAEVRKTLSWPRSWATFSLL